MNEIQIKHLVDRFLNWRLPKDFRPDAGISYKRPNYAPEVDATPSGTNLFSADQATEMVRHMIEGLPTAESMTPQPQDVGPEPLTCPCCTRAKSAVGFRVANDHEKICLNCGCQRDEDKRTPTPALRAEGAEAVAWHITKVYPGVQLTSAPSFDLIVQNKSTADAYASRGYTVMPLGPLQSPPAAPTEAEDAAKWRKLGLCYEGDLPDDISDAEYNWWYEHSQIILGARMGPVLAGRAQLRGGGE